MTELVDKRGRPRVVVTGLGALSPCGTGAAATWEAVKNGVSGVSAITLFDASSVPTKIAAEVKDFDASRWLDAKESRRFDRFIHFAIAAGDLAMEDAGYKISERDAPRVGVIIGTGIGGLGFIEKYSVLANERGPKKISPFFIPGVIANLAPGLVSIRHGAKGPNWSPVSACATGAHAIGEGLEMIRRGVCDAVIAGGSEAVVTQIGIGGFNAMKALSTRNDEPEKASRPWDKDRDGFVMGEGAGVLVIESLSHALDRGARIHAEISGYGATADAFHITQPEGEGAVRAMREAIDDSGLETQEIGYVNAHGTSTPVGDSQEIVAVKNVFGEYAKSIAVSSTKSMHGHLLGAAGGVEAVISVEALKAQIAPPTINLDQPDDECDINLVPHEAQRISCGAVLSNSFGFGGTNASLIFRKYDA